MSGIVKRTVFVDSSNNRVLHHDWCRVDTGIGTMVEPRGPFPLPPVDGVGATAARLDPTDDISRVDAMEQAAMGTEQTILSDERGMALHGGQVWPRVGY